MRGLERTLAIALVMVAIVACGEPADTATEESPPPATPQEVRAFCDRYDDVRNEDFSVMMNALVEVAPAELHDQVVRLSAESPRDGYWDDRAAVEDFMERCDD